MFFNGVSQGPTSALENNKDKYSRIGIVFVTPDNGIIMNSLTTKGLSNNETEYEAIIARLKLALEIFIKDLTVYGDLKLII